MITIDRFREIAFSLPEMEESPHFEKTSFRVAKKIVATVDLTKNIACVKLNEIDQSAFCSFDTSIIYPVPNKWGKSGWTFIELNRVNEETLIDAFKTAYVGVAPKRLAGLVLENG